MKISQNRWYIKQEREKNNSRDRCLILGPVDLSIPLFPLFQYLNFCKIFKDSDIKIIFHKK